MNKNIGGFNVRYILSFFQFYYYLITRNHEKRIEISMDAERYLIIFFTPVILFILLIIIGIISLTSLIMPAILLIAPITSLNVLILNKSISEGREREEVKRQREKEEREKRIRRDWERLYYERKKMREEAYERYRHQQYERHRDEWQRQRDNRQDHSTGQQYSTFTNHDSKLHQSLMILGLQIGASKKDVRIAYRNLCKKHHPDMGGKHEDFVKLNNAYKYVMDRV